MELLVIILGVSLILATIGCLGAISKQLEQLERIADAVEKLSSCVEEGRINSDDRN